MSKRIKSSTIDAAIELVHGQKGSFTLESSLVFPLLLAVVFAFMAFGLYLNQQMIVHYSAAVTAERAAFAWDNSHREPWSGFLPEPRYDGLYRRLGKDGAIAALFGLTGTDESAAVAIVPGGAPEGETGSGLTRTKLYNAASWLESSGLSYTGEARYDAGGLNRYVRVSLKHPLGLSGGNLPGGRVPKAAYSGTIVDPAEFIRTVDLARYYYAKFQNRGKGKEQSKSEAGQVLAKYGNKP